MHSHIITSGISYAQLVEDLRLVIRQEVNAAIAQKKDLPDIGGIELAQQLTKLSKARIYALVSSRDIPHAKRGNRLYFNRADLETWVSCGSR